MLDGIENMIDNNKPSLNGERFLTDKEVSERLKLSRRTLQEYRTEGKIPYYQLGAVKSCTGKAR
jgi:excisionase family DNA binding protein